MKDEYTDGITDKLLNFNAPDSEIDLEELIDEYCDPDDDGTDDEPGHPAAPQPPW